MPRQRKQRNTEEVNTNTNTNVSQTTNGEVYKMALSQEQIAALLAGSRQKGQYTNILNRFIQSGEGGIEAAVEYPELAGKAASTVKQGFENAIKNKDAAAGAENVKVLLSGEGDNKSVYLINLAAETVEAPAEV